MKALKNITVFILILAIVLAVGCAPSADKVTIGKLDGTVYTNDYFNLKLELPAEWHVATEEEKAMLTNAGADIVGGDNDNLKKQLDLSKEKTLNLVFAFQHTLDYTEGFNPNFMCIAENLGLAGFAVKNGEDYLNATRSLIEQSQLPYSFEEIGTETIGGKEFYVMPTSIDVGGLIISQKYYSAVQKGYALNFITSYSSEEELATVSNILGTVKFK